MTMPWNVEHLKDDYNWTSSGHFFDKDTMRFFKSRLTSHFKRINDHVAYFITTEKAGFENYTRVATLRRVELKEENGGGYIRRKYRIETVEGFHGVTMYQAKKALKEMKE